MLVCGNAINLMSHLFGYNDLWRCNDWKWQVIQREDGRFSGKSGERVGVEERKIEHFRKRVGKASLYIHKW